MEEAKTLSYDELLSEHVGEFGPYQRRVYLLLCLPAVLCAAHTYVWPFVSVDVEHRCKLADGDREWSSAVGAANPNFSFGSAGACSRLADDGRLESCAESYVWNSVPEHAEYSALQEWSLVCERKVLKALVQSALYVGLFFGSLILGYLADLYGRKSVLVVGLTSLSAVASLSVLSSNVYVFAFSRFLVGLLEPAVWQVPFIIAVELVGPSCRVEAGMLIEFFFSGGLVLISVLAYFVRDWRKLQLAVSLPGFLFIAYFWLLPESARWQLASRRKTAAIKTLEKAARVNGVRLADGLLETLEELSEPTADAESSPANTGDDEGSVGSDTEQLQLTARRFGYFDTVRTPNIRRNTVVCCYCWIVVTLVYYGISLNPSAIGGDFYVSFILSALVELPALGFVMLLLKRLGRRSLLSAGHLVCGLVLLLAGWLPRDRQPAALISLVMLAKFVSTAVFSIIYLHSSEIFPTVIRSVSLGLFVTLSRIGAILAPIASVYMTNDYRLPVLLCFGLLSVLAALLTLLLPESNGRKMPETIEDGEKFASDFKFCWAPKSGASEPITKTDMLDGVRFA